MLSPLLFSCDNNYELKNKELMKVADTTKQVKTFVPKQQDTIFIRHDSDWTSENLRYITDTIIFESGMRRNILTGTTILSSTHNQYSAYWEYGVYFKGVTKSDCQKSAEEFEGLGMGIETKINSIIITDSTITIDINVFDNCCYDFLCDVSIVDGSIINLIYTGYGTHCDCDCCYGLTYKFEKLKDPAYKKMKSVMLNGNKQTIKRIN